MSLRKMFTPVVFVLTTILFLTLFYISKSNLLIALAVLSIIDFVSGILKAVKNNQLNSKVCFNGICKKFYMFSIVAVAYILEFLLDVPVFSVFISFYLANEGLSIIENAGDSIPLPSGLKEKFVQIRDEGITYEDK